MHPAVIHVIAYSTRLTLAGRNRSDADSTLAQGNGIQRTHTVGTSVNGLPDELR